MIGRQIQRRDLEILRTLLRLRYVTTRELVTGFFSTSSVGRRRIRRIAEMDLIGTHRKVVPEALQYSAWRLTYRGLELVADAFPDEPIPDGLEERLAAGRLYNLDHRAGLTRLYLDLVRGGAAGSDSDDASDATRERASGFEWQPDGDVVLRFKRLAEEVQFVPDATVCGRQRQVRVFVELDRSTRGLSRIADNLGRYAAFLRQHYGASFADGRAPILLYVVRSAGRKASITDLAARVFGAGVRWGVAMEAEAPAWLGEAVLEPGYRSIAEPTKEPPREDLLELAKGIYAWARGYERQLRVEGRALPPDGEALLLRLYQQLKVRQEPRSAG